MGGTQHTGLLRAQGQTDTALCRDVLGLPSGPSAWPLPCLPLLTDDHLPHTRGGAGSRPPQQTPDTSPSWGEHPGAARQSRGLPGYVAQL